MPLVLCHMTSVLCHMTVVMCHMTLVLCYMTVVDSCCVVDIKTLYNDIDVTAGAHSVTVVSSCCAFRDCGLQLVCIP